MGVGDLGSFPKLYYQEITLKEYWQVWYTNWQEGGSHEGIFGQNFHSRSTLRESVKALKNIKAWFWNLKIRKEELSVQNTLRKWENHGRDHWRG